MVVVLSEKKIPRRPEDIEAPPKIAYDEDGQEVELIETMKLLPVNNVENSRDMRYKAKYIAEVTLVHPESHILRAFMDQKSLYRKLLHARAMYKSYDESSVRHDFKKAQTWLAKAERLRSRLCSAVRKKRKKRFVCRKMMFTALLSCLTTKSHASDV